MNKLLRNRKFQIISAVVILLIVVLLSADRFSKVNIIRSIFTAPVTFVQKGINAIGDWTDGLAASVRRYAVVVDENSELKNENLILKEHLAVRADVEDENERLKEALNLNSRFSNYEIIGANIVGTDPGNFLYSLIHLDVFPGAGMFDGNVGPQVIIFIVL